MTDAEALAEATDLVAGAYQVLSAELAGFLRGKHYRIPWLERALKLLERQGRIPTNVLPFPGDEYVADGPRGSH